MTKEKPVRQNYFLVFFACTVFLAGLILFVLRLQKEIDEKPLCSEEAASETASSEYKDLPADFPVYQEAKFLTFAVSDNSKGKSFIWESQDDISLIFETMKSELRIKGYEVFDDLSVGDFLSLSFKKDNIEGFLGVFKGEDEKSVISVSIKEF